jgi:hypothetical protein
MMKPQTWLFTFFLLGTTLALAHGGVDDGHTDELLPYSVEIESRPVFPIQNEPVKLTIHIESVGDSHEHLAGLNTELEILRERIPIMEDSENLGHYQAEYTFTKFGQEEMTVWVEDVGYLYAVDILRPPGNSPLAFYLVVVFIILTGLLCYFVFIKKSVKFSSGVTYFSILSIVVGLSYSVIAFNQSEAVEGCTLKVGNEYVYHCHQNIRVEICGNSKGFDWEGGDLGRGHTHKGNHRIHWHPDIPEENPFATMTLRNLFADFELELTEFSIQDPESKEVLRDDTDACNNGKDNTVIVYEKLEDAAEETLLTDFLNHPLQDEATYRIVYE